MLRNHQSAAKTVLSFILCFPKENLFFLVTFVNSNYFIFIMKIVFFLHMDILFLFILDFFYFHSVKTQSNNYLYVKCTSLPNVDAYITECFTEVQISRTTSERLIQKQLLSVVS